MVNKNIFSLFRDEFKIFFYFIPIPLSTMTVRPSFITPNYLFVYLFYGNTISRGENREKNRSYWELLRKW